MSWKEREREIDEALSVLKKLQRRGSRIHLDARVEIAARQIALERGDCRRCQSLTMQIKRIGTGKEGVVLGCLSGRLPLEIYRDCVYNPEQIPSCDLLVPFEEEE